MKNIMFFSTYLMCICLLPDSNYCVTSCLTGENTEISLLSMFTLVLCFSSSHFFLVGEG